MENAENAGFVTQAEYARRKAISRQRVHQLVKDGRIPVSAEGLVDVAQADVNLATMLDQRKANRDRQIQLAAAPAAMVVMTPEGKPALASLPLEEPEVTRPAAQGSSNAGDYWEHKARRERIEADRADLAYRKQIGELVDAAEVKRSRHETAYKVANALMQIPARVAPVVAPQDPLRAEKLLADEIRKVLHELATDLDGQPGSDAGRADARAA